MLSVQEVAAKVERLKTRNMDRDRRMADVLAVRQGRMQDVFFGQFSDEYPKPLIANMVDIAARDLAEVTAPLPAINCASSNMTSDAARKKAEIRTRIANHYANKSDLQLQMYQAADWYYTYGFAAGMVVATIIAGYHWTLIRTREREGCFAAFRHNNWLGAAIFLGIVLG